MLEDKSFLDEVEKACQCSAQGQDKCDNEMHIHALDSRAAVFEKMDHIDRAKKDASWILELAPGLPQVSLALAAHVTTLPFPNTDDGQGLPSTRKHHETSEK